VFCRNASEEYFAPTAGPAVSDAFIGESSSQAAAINTAMPKATKFHPSNLPGLNPIEECSFWTRDCFKGWLIFLTRHPFDCLGSPPHRQPFLYPLFELFGSSLDATSPSRYLFSEI
jgi:hypothetical protein